MNSAEKQELLNQHKEYLKSYSKKTFRSKNTRPLTISEFEALIDKTEEFKKIAKERGWKAKYYGED